MWVARGNELPAMRSIGAICDYLRFIGRAGIHSSRHAPRAVAELPKTAALLTGIAVQSPLLLRHTECAC